MTLTTDQVYLYLFLLLGSFLFALPTLFAIISYSLFEPKWRKMTQEEKKYFDDSAQKSKDRKMLRKRAWRDLIQSYFGKM